MMRQRHLAFFLVIGLVLVLGIALGWVGSSMAAGEPLPGSEQDPLVSRSYLDMRFEAFTSEAGGAKLVVVEIPAGQALIGSAGSEIIVRSGTATIIDSQAGGLADVTDGKDLRQGDAAPKNHLLLVPRDDGRGISAVTAVIAMVRGAYTLR